MATSSSAAMVGHVTEVGKNMAGAPRNDHVSRIEASYFDPGTAYVTLDSHRNDDMRPYVNVTRDFGQTWQAIANNLPASGCVNVIKQDPVQPAGGGGAGGGGGGGGGSGGGRGGGAPALPAGAYVITLTVNGKSLSEPVNILEDVWMHER